MSCSSEIFRHCRFKELNNNIHGHSSFELSSVNMVRYLPLARRERNFESKIYVHQVKNKSKESRRYDKDIETGESQGRTEHESFLKLNYKSLLFVVLHKVQKIIQHAAV